MLNDPMEANAVEINLGCAGSGYTLACGKVHPIIEEQQINIGCFHFPLFLILQSCGHTMQIAILGVV